MTTYLTGGWYSRDPARGLRTEVLDGSMDAAGILHRARLSPEQVSRLALRVRGLVRLDAMDAAVGPDEREILARHLDPIVGDSAELSSFVADCLDHVSTHSELMAFYLHLVHITRMMQLLVLARRGPAPTQPQGGRAVRASRPPKRRAAHPSRPSRKASAKGRSKKRSLKSRSARAKRLTPRHSPARHRR
jgi:hypothetical protein